LLALQKKGFMTTNNNDIDLREFLIRVIVYHLKHIRFFLTGFLLFIVGGIFIYFFVPPTYQAKILLEVGSIPSKMLKNENLTFFSNIKNKNITLKEINDSTYYGYQTIILMIKNDTSELHDFIAKYITFFRQNTLINKYITYNRIRLQNELTEIDTVLERLSNSTSTNYPVDKLLTMKQNINYKINFLKNVSYVKTIKISKIHTIKLLLILFYFLAITLLTYCCVFIVSNKDKIKQALTNS